MGPCLYGGESSFFSGNSVGFVAESGRFDVLVSALVPPPTPTQVALPSPEKVADEARGGPSTSPLEPLPAPSPLFSPNKLEDSAPAPLAKPVQPNPEVNSDLASRRTLCKSAGNLKWSLY